MALPAPARLFFLVSCLFAATAPAWAALPAGAPPLILTEQAKIVASDGQELDDFGNSVALSGDTAVVGANMDDFPTGGSAYVFIRQGSSWSEQTKLLGPPNAWFGTSVAISGDTAVIGAPGEAGGGSAYIFVRNGTSWSQQAKLTPPDASPLASFGRSVAIDGESVIVGAPNDWIGGAPDVGSAYVFVRSGSSWSEQAKLIASDGAQGDLFGEFAVAISGDSAAMSAFGRQDFQGAVYLFARSGSSWSEQAELLGPEAGAWFGSALAISGDTAAVGAAGTDAAYVYRRTGSSWLQEATLQASGQGGGFGDSLALSGDTLVVGDPWNAAYVFLRGPTGWYERAELRPSDLQGGSSSFGGAVAISGDTVIVGAMINSTPDWTQLLGACYVFSLTLSPGVTLNPGAGLITTEWGGTAQFFVTLNSPPAGDVVIDLASSAPGEGSVSPPQLRFTPDDWSMFQTVTLTGVNDFVRDGNQIYSAVLTMNTRLTTDPVYAAIDPPDPTAVNLGLEGELFTIVPCRVLDTRQPEHAPGLSSGVKRLVALHNACGIPDTAGAVAVTVTVVNPTGDGTLSLYPGDLTPSGLSSLTFKQGQTLSGNAIVPLATDNTGTLAVWPFLANNGSSHLVIDVSGYFE